jgi:hypothetical protein
MVVSMVRDNSTNFVVLLVRSFCSKQVIISNALLTLHYHYHHLLLLILLLLTLFSLTEYGQDNTTAWLYSTLGNHPILINEVEQEYAFGTTANGWPITDDNQQISAIYTDAVYQCPMAVMANDSITGSIPTWRYLYNATFPDLQPFPGSGVYHGSESMTFTF